MSGVAVSGKPSGFWLALPPGWVSFDVDPSTSKQSARALVAAAAAADETVAANRDALERILVSAAQEAATGGVSYCAAYYEDFGDFSVQAALSVAIHASADGTDPSRIVTELQDEEGGRVITTVDLHAGRAVRRSGRRHTRFPGTDEPMELVTHQFFIPVPGTTGLLAAIAFSSPTLALEEDLIALFDSIADTFAFTWDDDQ